MPPLLPRLALLGLALAAAVPARGARSIEFTHVPAFGQSADQILTGRVHGGDPSGQRIAVYIRVGDGWWTKPTFAQPLTAIQNDGTWSANIVSGGDDSKATQIAAYLVPATFVPPEVGGNACVPASIAGAALASAVVVRPNPALRNLRWSGFDWYLKDSGGIRVGPGDNYFSNSADQVWIDAQNRLHLRISQTDGKWQCAEVISYLTPGYGRYVFHGATAVDALDANAVLGLFTWADRNEDPNHREIDIEWARWGNPAETTNAQFVVQPYAPAGHLQRITVPSSIVASVQRWDWSAAGVSFQMLEEPNAITWTYPAANTDPKNLPVSCDESVHLNLWLCNTAGPAGGQPVEVVLSAFEHLPPDSDTDRMSDPWERAHGLDPISSSDAAADDDADGFSNLQEFLADTDPANRASALLVASHSLTGASPQITFTTRPDKTYKVEGSDALEPGSWTVVVANVGGTGAPVTVTLPATPGAPRKFYRARLSEP